MSTRIWGLIDVQRSTIATIWSIGRLYFAWFHQDWMSLWSWGRSSPALFLGKAQVGIWQR